MKDDVQKKLRTRELQRIAKEHGGILLPEDVVATARNPKNILHADFEWDDTKAAHLYRLARASQLIRFTIEWLPAANEDVRMFVSLREDKRDGGEGGYRLMSTVMSDKELYRLMLEDARIDYEAFKNKYVKLRELQPLFAAGKKIKALRRR